jgi:hypothetical protein
MKSVVSTIEQALNRQRAIAISDTWRISHSVKYDSKSQLKWSKCKRGKHQGPSGIRILNSNGWQTNPLPDWAKGKVWLVVVVWHCYILPLSTEVLTTRLCSISGTRDPDLASNHPLHLWFPAEPSNVTEENTRVRVGFESLTLKVDRQTLYLTELKERSGL